MAHATIAFWHLFHPWTTKSMDLETVYSTTPNHRKSTNCPKVDPGRLPKSIRKSVETDIWASGVPLDPRITKMVSQVPKKEPAGVQTSKSRWREMKPLLQSTCQQLLPAMGIDLQITLILRSTIHSLPIWYWLLAVCC